MSDPFDTCLAFTLQQEGGFTDNPKDPGGATCQGITLATLRTWTGKPSLGVADIRNISAATVQAIYRADYWNRMRCDALPPGVDLMVFDHGVNTGTASAARLLQQALGMTGAAASGSVDAKTLAGSAEADPTALIGLLADRQTAYYHSLSGFATFGKGWLARVTRRKTAAMKMLQPALV